MLEGQGDDPPAGDIGWLLWAIRRSAFDPLTRLAFMVLRGIGRLTGNR